MTPLDLDEIARRPTMLYRDEEAFVVLLPAERDALVERARVGVGHALTLQMVQEMLTVPAAEYVPAIVDALWQIDLALREGGCAAPTLAARGPEMPADVAGTVRRLKSCTAQHARTTPRDVATLANNAATLIETLDRQRRELEATLSGVSILKNVAMEHAAAREHQLAAAELRAEQAEKEVARLTGLVGHIREHITRDEDFDADELLADIKGSVDLSEFDRLLLRIQQAEGERDAARFYRKQAIEHAKAAEKELAVLRPEYERVVKTMHEQEDHLAALEDVVTAYIEADVEPHFATKPTSI